MDSYGSTVRRHAGDVRVAHLAWAITSGWLIASGLGIHERLPAWAIHLLGGHVVLVTWHGYLGNVTSACRRGRSICLAATWCS